VVIRGHAAATAVLAAVAVVAVVVTAVMWSTQRDERNDLSTQARVTRAAADWAEVLINLTDENGNAGVQKLRDNTTGDLRAQFDAVLQRYRDEVRTLSLPINGQINSVALESIHERVTAKPNAPPTQGGDTVLVVGTTQGKDSGGTAHTIRWYLRIGVTDVSGKLLISSLERIQ
jgi:hypothetical protein